MSNLLEKFNTLLRAVPTWITLATVVLTAALQVAEGEGLNAAAAWIATALVVVGAAAAIVRRVTPVPKAERGL